MIEQESGQRSVIGGVHIDAGSCFTPAERANEGDKLAKFGVRELKRGHPFRGQTGANERGELPVRLQRYARRYAGSHLAAAAIRTVTSCTRLLEYNAPGARPGRLRIDDPGH